MAAQPTSPAVPPVARPAGSRSPGPGRNWRSWPAALKMSSAFGLAAFVVLVAGIVSRATPVLIVATSLGSASLISALVWRAQLIEAWRSEKGRPSRQW